MKKKIFYWSPCLNPVGTIKSTLNSAISLKKYNNTNDIFMIDVCGEWAKYQKVLADNSISLINLNFQYFKFLPKRGFFFKQTLLHNNICIIFHSPCKFIEKS